MKSRMAAYALVPCMALAAGSSLANRAAAAPSPIQPEPSAIVTLVCVRFSANFCAELARVAADGTLTAYSPQPGFTLVITDFMWKAAQVSPGQVAFATLHHASTSPPRDVAFSTAVGTLDGAAVAESRFSTGLPFSDIPIVFVSNAPDVAIVHGYLARSGRD